MSSRHTYHISHCSLALIKQIGKDSFSGVCGSRAHPHHGKAAWQPAAEVAESSRLISRKQRRNSNDWHSKIPPPSDILPSAKPHLLSLPKQDHPWKPSIQMPETVGNSSQSTNPVSIAISHHMSPNKVTRQKSLLPFSR